MTISKDYKKEALATINKCLDNVLANVAKRLGDNTFHSPFEEALDLPFESTFWPAFERSFTSSLGKAFEELARIFAIANGATSAICQAETNIVLDDAFVAAVDKYLMNQRSNKTGVNRDWASTLACIQNTVPIGKSSQFRIISDLMWVKDGVSNYLSMKTVKPNIDQSERAKKDCLYLALTKPDCNAYFGLPYNPYGDTRKSYKWSMPNRIFDMQNDPVVLIGKDMWDKIGGSGCYDLLLSIFSEAGKKYASKLEALKQKCPITS